MKPSRRYFCYLLSAIATVKASAQSWLLPSKAFPYETIPVHQQPHSRLRHFFDGETHTGFAVELHESELAAGDAPHPPHHHVHEEVILIREGTVDVMISGQSTRLGPGSVAYIASNEEHGWRNVGTTPARYYLFALGPAWDYRERMAETKCRRSPGGFKATGMVTGMAQSVERANLEEALRAFHTETGRSLLELVDESPLLLVFLRHFACAFCAQTLDHVAKLRSQIEAKGVRPVFVHLGSPERAKPYFDYYKLSDVERVSNPDATLYQVPAFGLSRTNPYLHSLHPAVLMGWLKGAIFKYGIGMIKEDGEQMPGVFFLKERKIVRAFRHRTIADEPNYLKLVGAG